MKPFTYSNGTEKYYKYLLDPISLGIVDFINSCPGSIMEQWSRMNTREKENAEYEKREFIPVTDIEAAKEAIVLYPQLKKELLDAIYSIKLEKIMNVKIKDVLAKQISGMGHPVHSVRDVIHYSELPVLCSAVNLFNKNIITTANDTEGCFNDGDYVPTSGVYITNLIIDYESLDEANKLVADSLVESGNAKYQEKSFVGKGKGLILEVPCKRDEFVYDVNLRMMKLVSQFHKQYMIYGKASVYDIYEAMSIHWLFLSEEEKIEVSSILEQGYTSENIKTALEYFYYLNYYYDDVEDCFWTSEYYYKKHKEYLEENEYGGKDLK